MKYIKMLILAAAVAVCGCAAKDKGATDSAAASDTPYTSSFCADSAFAYVAAQTAFGPRVPGTEASRRCAQWLASTLERLGADTVMVSTGTVTAYEGTRLPISNISARFNTSVPKRVLLLAHWDSRPWADQDGDAERRMQPIDGANDGASGVAVILELLRGLDSNVGVDVLFVDAEDYGRREGDEAHGDAIDSWCLGTQEWLKAPTLPLGDISYAVLLDMVGGRDATFPHEYHSLLAAPNLCGRLTHAAAKAGTSARFPNEPGGPVLDDHVYLIAAGIPAIDIIESQHPQTGSFNPTWHTAEDKLENIDPATLDAVGRTVEALIRN